MVDSTNGVGANQEIRYAQDLNGLKTPEQRGENVPNSVNAQQVNTRGKGTEVQTQTNFNLYGKDITNFENFKGNDKNDAMRITQTAANDVKKAYMQLQHEYPNIVIAFEAMPDPKSCGKKREGFFNYQQQLNDWKDIALTQIANARETSTAEGFREVKENDNRNAAMNAAVTTATGAAIMANDNINTAVTLEKIDENSKDIKKAVHGEGAATRNLIKEDGDATRETIIRESVRTRNKISYEEADTRNLVRRESTSTRDTVRGTSQETIDEVNDKAHETQVLNGLSDKINSLLITEHLKEAKDGVSDMRNKILQSDVSFETKQMLMEHLADFTNQTVITSGELTKEQRYIDKELNAAPRANRHGGFGIEPYPYQERPNIEPMPPYGNGAPKAEKSGDVPESDKSKPSVPESKKEPVKPAPEGGFDGDTKPVEDGDAKPIEKDVEPNSQETPADIEPKKQKRKHFKMP